MPRAVFLTPVLPSRSGMGLAMRAGSQLAGMMRVFDVKTLLIPLIETGQTGGSFAAAFPGSGLERVACVGEVDHYFRLIASLVDPQERLLHFERYGKPSLVAALSGSVVQRVAERVQHHGATHIHVFRSYLLPALDLLPHATTRSIDLDEDDASSFLSSAAVLEARRCPEAARWARLEALAFDRLIALRLKNFGCVTLANAEDIPGFLGRHPGLPLQALPNGVDVPTLASITPGGHRKDILFVGSLRYEPNVDGLLWFVTSVLPRLPKARLLVAGRAPPPQLLAWARPGRVEFLGYVERLACAYRHAALAIAPMRSGGGTRLKILEAGAHGVPVVATPEAAKGLWKQGRFWGMTATSARHFAGACRRLLENPQEAQRLGRLGRHAVAADFSSVRVEDAWSTMFEGLQKGLQP
ncbi:glycosyltransferase family 4 protein [Aestuariivirga sp.]|uniref:glycosyltransferase family 4 protein n=1 Tax=Aestuariivirga sp. TaxID=2650926 RepID=UPI00391B8CCB